MKKVMAAILALMTAFFALPAVADLAADIEAGSAMTFDELLEKAETETGNFVVAGNTSRIVKAAATFSSLYDIDIEATNMKDQAIYDKLDNEVVDMRQRTGNQKCMGTDRTGIEGESAVQKSRERNCEYELSGHADKRLLER